MSCRWACAGAATGPAPLVALETVGDAAATYMDLARALRWDDFRWFARSRGMSPEAIDRLWRELQTRLRRGGR
jgi:hypothetical protein